MAYGGFVQTFDRQMAEDNRGHTARDVAEGFGKEPEFYMHEVA
jgi:hypothetical protein